MSQQLPLSVQRSTPSVVQLFVGTAYLVVDAIYYDHELPLEVHSLRYDDDYSSEVHCPIVNLERNSRRTTFVLPLLCYTTITAPAEERAQHSTRGTGGREEQVVRSFQETSFNEFTDFVHD